MSSDPVVQIEAAFRPTSLREINGRWTIFSADGKNRTLSNRALPGTLELVRRALDHGERIEYVPEPDDRLSVVQVTTKIGKELPKSIVDSAPKMKPEWEPSVWVKRIPQTTASYEEDRVQWITHLPDNKFTRVRLTIRAAPVYLPDNHPRQKSLLELLNKAITTGQPVRLACFSHFLVDVIEADVNAKRP